MKVNRQTNVEVQREADHIISMNDMVIELATRDKEIERLQAKVERLTKRGFQDLNWQNDELQKENQRLRGLLKECRPYVEGGPICDTRLCDRVEKEVGNE